MSLSTQDHGVRTCDRTRPLGRYQRLHAGRAQSGIVNLTGFGRALQRACRSDRLCAILDQHGFFDGGCLSLALALQSHTGPGAEIVYVGRPGRLDHAVCAVEIGGRRVYLDADGLADARDLKGKMRHVELAGQETARLTIRAASAQRARRAGIVDWDQKSRPLARGLASLFRRFPDRTTWLAPMEM